MADTETLSRAPATPSVAPRRSRRPASASDPAVDYVRPRAVRKDPTVRVLEMDRVILAITPKPFQMSQIRQYPTRPR